MKPISSEITGLQRRVETPQRQTGLQHGETGVVGRKMSPRIPAADVDTALQFLTQFAKRAMRGEDFDQGFIQMARGEIEKLDGRCDWRAAADYLNAMIYSYSKPGDDPATIKTLASEFMTVLDGYPTWAVVRAMRWWQSDENKFSHIRPRHGDITAKCKDLTAAVRVSGAQIEKIMQREDV